MRARTSAGGSSAGAQVGGQPLAVGAAASGLPRLERRRRTWRTPSSRSSVLASTIDSASRPGPPSRAPRPRPARTAGVGPPGRARGGRSSTGTTASPAGGACACRVRRTRGRRARCPRDAASARGRRHPRSCTSPCGRCRWRRPRRERTARWTRTSGSRSVRSPPPRGSPARGPRCGHGQTPARRARRRCRGGP